MDNKVLAMNLHRDIYRMAGSERVLDLVNPNQPAIILGRIAFDRDHSMLLTFSNTQFKGIEMAFEPNKNYPYAVYVGVAKSSKVKFWKKDLQIQLIFQRSHNSYIWGQYVVTEIASGKVVIQESIGIPIYSHGIPRLK